MPEHHPSTPAPLAALESFLWHDAPVDAAGWVAWVQRHLPHAGRSANTSFVRAVRLHAALRLLQAANGDTGRRPTDTGPFNRLVEDWGIRPCVQENGALAFAAADPADPASMLLFQVLDAMGSGLWQRFRLCDDPECHASFFDASKGGGRRWCSMARCGSRNKMRRLRSRG